mgnify:CR=1 FL=1
MHAVAGLQKIANFVGFCNTKSIELPLWSVVCGVAYTTGHMVEIAEHRQRLNLFTCSDLLLLS